MRLCPWSLASSIPVLGLESVCPRKSCPWPRIFFVSLALASSLVSSTPPQVLTIVLFKSVQSIVFVFFVFRWLKKICYDDHSIYYLLTCSPLLYNFTFNLVCGNANNVLKTTFVLNSCITAMQHCI